jgi:hypothetical protein
MCGNVLGTKLKQISHFLPLHHHFSPLFDKARINLKQIQKQKSLILQGF